MSAYFEELDSRSTAIGVVSLRRRYLMALRTDVYEIKLGDQYLMSSLFTASETALGDAAIAEHGSGAGGSRKDAVGNLDVAVGGLGLGYTARAVLGHEAVRSLLVVEMLEAVIEWHERGLLPASAALTGDPRCRFVTGDFFELSTSETGFDAHAPRRRFDVILVDIDHTPEKLLDARSIAFYHPEGLRQLAKHLKPEGVFGLWSNEPPGEKFTERLQTVFGSARAQPVTFHNPLQDREFTQTVYLARGGP